MDAEPARAPHGSLLAEPVCDVESGTAMPGGRDGLRSTTLRSYRDGGAHIIALAETFEQVNLVDLERALVDARAGAARVVVLDLRELKSVDSIDHIVELAHLRVPNRVTVVHRTQREDTTFGTHGVARLRPANGARRHGRRRQTDQHSPGALVEGAEGQPDRAPPGAFAPLRACWRTILALSPTPARPR